MIDYMLILSVSANATNTTGTGISSIALDWLQNKSFASEDAEAIHHVQQLRYRLLKCHTFNNAF